MTDFGTLRSLLQRPPSTTLWEELCEIVDKTPSPQLEAQFLPYIHGHLRRWPEDIKQTAPMRWVEQMLAGDAPAKLSLCSNLHIDGEQPEGAFENLVTCPYFGGLESLRISDWSIEPHSLEILAAELKTPSLTKLSLNRCALGDDGLAILCANNTWLGQLTELSLWGNTLSCVAMTYLCNHLRGTNLRHLSLWDNQLNTLGMSTLSNAPQLINLEHLDVDNNEIPDEGFVLLAQSPYIKNLHTLYAFENEMTAPGFKALCQSANLHGLESLNIRFNKVGDEGIEALADSLMLSTLRKLNVADTNIGDAAISVLVNSAHFARVERFTAWSNKITDEGAQIIANSPHVHALNFLDLDLNEITHEGRQLLANSQHLSDAVRLRFLD